MLTEATTPCRPHLMDILRAIPAPIRAIAHWRMTEQTWDRITADPDFRGSCEVVPRYACPTERLFYGVQVHLNGRGDGVELIIPTDCLTGERVHT